MLGQLRRLILCTACVIVFSAGAAAEGSDGDDAGEHNSGQKRKLPEVVVSANRMGTPAKKVGSSVSVLTAEEIAKQKQTTVLEVLKTVPGVDVVRSGGAGGNTAVFIRGANPEHTLVLVDGVEVNNPINPQRSFNFADLTVDNIERIEVLRGPQTTLYGSDAMGGVIQLFTKKGKGEPTVQMSTEVGSYDTYREAVTSQGAGNGVSYSFGFSRLDRQGMSAVTNPLGAAENDKYEDTAGSARLSAKPIEQVELVATGRITNSHSEIDDGPGSGDDDPNRYFNTDQYSTRGAANIEWLKEVFTQTYGISYSGTNFDDNNDPDPDHPLDKLVSNYKGHQLKVDMQNTWTFAEDGTFVFGAETEEEKGSSTLSSESAFGPFTSDFLGRSVRTNGIYGQVQGDPIESLTLTLGGRVDDNSRFGTRENWRFSSAYMVEQTKTRVKGSVGTAYKAPSLYQLYSEFGRQDLQPERSLGVDGGFEQEVWGKEVTAGGTYFYNHYTDLISFNPDTFIFENILKAKTRGIEAFVSVSPIEDLVFRTNYTYLDTEDESTGERLLRRAKHRINFDLDYKCLGGFSTHANLLVVGTRADNDFSTFPAARLQLPAYAVVNLAAEYELTKSLSFFAHADNIFDKDYQEVFGYNTPGATVFGGVKVKL